MNAEQTLFQAAATGSVSMAKTACAAGARPSAIGPGGATALHIAAAQGHSHVAEFLLAGGADPNVQDGFGRTPLHEAAFVRSKSPQTWETLIAHGADPHGPRDRDGRTPEALAMTLDYGKALNNLIEHNAQRVARGLEPTLGR
ncbi:ankyrin repeat domain-containing protein [Rhodanobacter sp. FW102-FHT14D06]|uniref:Ankyrin repeat domain-containing protein n=2 Tax=unclassified Rhodanobacter TaxID=2621553 RepID=A0AB74UW94_9GAMM